VRAKSAYFVPEKPMKISFCLITLNEAANLPRALKSCAGLADEIIVLDSGSTDATEQIAREHGARFETQKWLGYVGQKNKVISLAQNEWVFSLDADEELSPALREEILTLKKSTVASDVSGFSMPRCVLFGGRWIRHGDWYPDRKTRLWRRGQGQWRGEDPHYKLVVNGRTGRLKNDLQHFTNESINQHLQKITRFSDEFVRQRQAAGRWPGFFDLAVRPVWRFLRAYFFRLGFLDGWPGYYIAWLNAFSTLTRYCKLCELRLKQSRPDEDVAHH
jgi:glycosyltransferase involved in cell wall biosynthesis